MVVRAGPGNISEVNLNFQVRYSISWAQTILMVDCFNPLSIFNNYSPALKKWGLYWICPVCPSVISKLDITIDGNKIKQVDKQKLLGVYIDKNLLWTTHIDYLCSTISTKISLLKQLSRYVPVKVQKLFYQRYILPLIDYGSNTWRSTSKLNIERLSKLQKRAARIILKADFDTPSSEMFNELGWSAIANRHNYMYNKGVLTFKALNDLTPEYISDLLKPTSETHNRNLWSATNGSLSVPRSRTSLFDRSFSATAPKLWNSLPKEIITASSLENFKQLAKTHFMNR